MEGAKNSHAAGTSTAGTPAMPPELRAELEAIYEAVDREVRDSTVVCWTRGLCCDFEKVDHVLYASGIELAYVRELHPEPFPAGSKLCPFWRDGLCTLRERRPLGCRTYFCDESFKERLEAIHERAYAKIKQLARDYEVPWEYAPFVAGLREPGS